jgi:hypothetical protein
MTKSNHVTKKSKQKGQTRRGRPATGIGVQIGMRWQPEVLTEIDEWRRVQEDLPDRPTAIRRLVEIGLSASRTKSTKKSQAE